jgi:hypothetical protein
MRMSLCTQQIYHQYGDVHICRVLIKESCNLLPMKKANLLLTLALACFHPALAQSAKQTAAQAASKTAPTATPKPATPAPPTETSNDELKALVARDQAAHTAASAGAESKETDADRRAILRQMIDAAALHTGLDYRNAALIMQHGDQPDDYLLAHSLAIIGASKEDKVALWLCAATLDRYLQSLNWPQIYGTQFTYASPNTPPLQDPYNRTLLSDALRQATGVPTLDEQAKQAKQLEKQ